MCGLRTEEPGRLRLIMLNGKKRKGSSYLGQRMVRNLGLT